MRVVFLFLIAIFSFVQLDGQITPYEPNDFGNLEPVWQHLVSDSTTIELDETKYDGINHFSFYMNLPAPFLFQDNFLYIGLNTTIQMRTLNEGGYVEKIDLETGKSIWKDYFDLRDSDYREFVESLSLDENGQLKVITARNIKPTFPDDYNDIGYAGVGDSAMISIRLYDTLTGELAEHIVNDYSPDSTQWIYYDIADNTLLKPASNNRYYYNRYDYYNNSYCQYLMNERGVLIEENRCDSITFDLPYDDVIYSQENRAKMFRVSEDTLLTLDYIKNNEKETIEQTKLTLYDKSLQKRKIISLDSILKFNYRTLRLRSADKNYIYLFGMIPGSIPHTSWDDTMAHCIINWEGVPENQFKNLLNDVRLGEFVVCPLIIENELLLAERSSDPAGFNFFITNKNTAGGFELLKRVYFNNPEYVFSIHELFQLENGDILLYGLNKSKPDWSDYYIGNWHTFIRIPAEDLGLKTRVKEPAIMLQDKPIIYPNPVQTNLNVSFNNEFNGTVNLYDFLGSLVLSKECYQAKSLNLNISSFPSGMYFIWIMDADGNLKYDLSRFIKK
jgi:hypothetical protein